MKKVILNRLSALPGKGHHHTLRFFNRVARLKGYRCNSCLHVRNFHTADHIILRSKGGTNDISNLQLLCLPCHKLKDNTVSSDGKYWETKVSINNVTDDVSINNAVQTILSETGRIDILENRSYNKCYAIISSHTSNELCNFKRIYINN